MYIFEINPLSVASFAIIFSQSEGCLFTLLIVSFAVQKLLSFILLAKELYANCNFNMQDKECQRKMYSLDKGHLSRPFSHTLYQLNVIILGEYLAIFFLLSFIDL